MWRTLLSLVCFVNLEADVQQVAESYVRRAADSEKWGPVDHCVGTWWKDATNAIVLFQLRIGPDSAWAQYGPSYGPSGPDRVGKQFYVLVRLHEHEGRWLVTELGPLYSGIMLVSTEEELAKEIEPLGLKSTRPETSPATDNPGHNPTSNPTTTKEKGERLMSTWVVIALIVFGGLIVVGIIGNSGGDSSSSSGSSSGNISYSGKDPADGGGGGSGR